MVYEVNANDTFGIYDSDGLQRFSHRGKHNQEVGQISCGVFCRNVQVNSRKSSEKLAFESISLDNYVLRYV